MKKLIFTIIFIFSFLLNAFAIDYAVLKNEIQTDPKGLGYAGKSDLGIANLINTAGLSGETINRGVIPSYEVINATVPAEWVALSTQEKQRYQIITGAGQVDSSNTNVQQMFLDMFSVNTATRANLITLVKRPASRAEILFGAGISINHLDIAKALRQ